MTLATPAASSADCIQPIFAIALPPVPLLTARLVTSGCPLSGMKREVRYPIRRCPRNCPGEVDMNMPLERKLWEGRIHH